MKDLHILPRLDSSWSFLYVEHCKIDQEDKAIAIHDADGRIPVPCAMLSLLMLGPGTSITHAAVKVLAESGCMVQWCGEEAVRFYALGMGETRSSKNLLRQAKAWADIDTRLRVVRQMYRIRFKDLPPEAASLQELRGKEGVRVREAYAQASAATGVKWEGRAYKRLDWKSADPVNRALSCASSCLYGICHAAIVSAGYSPAIGFIHTGKMLSFVYDVADLYKADVSIPIAFEVARQGERAIETRTRTACRDAFREMRVLERVVPDLELVFAGIGADGLEETGGYDGDEALPGPLWDPDTLVEGGVNQAFDAEVAEHGRDDPRKGPGIAQGRTDALDDRTEGGRFRR
jgi:CRISPR-associated protein Cas1